MLSGRGSRASGHGLLPGACPHSVPMPVFLMLMTAIVSTVTILEVHRAHTEAHKSGIKDGLVGYGHSKTPGVEDGAPMAYNLSVPNSELGGAEYVILQGDTEIEPMCHAEPNAEYEGEKVIKWGSQNLQDTVGDCCSSCTLEPDCNVWVYCGIHGGCNGRIHKECWLKKASFNTLSTSVGFGNPALPWTSGAIFNPEDRKEQEQKDKRRIKMLTEDPETPVVFLDVAIKGVKVGRITIALFAKEAPRAAENFRQLCTGEKGTVPVGHDGAGMQYSLKGITFYRIIDRFINQAGTATDSVFGGQFKDDPGGLALKHDRPGLLSMANAGPDSNTSHFSIVLSPAPHLDGHYVIFGEVVDGFEVVRKINALSQGKPDNMAGPEEEATIVDCGQLKGPGLNAEKQGDDKLISDSQ